MKKKFLLLGLSLLVCGGSAFAQKSISSYTELQTAVTEIGKLPALTKTLAEKEAAVERILAENVKDSVWRDTTITIKNVTTDTIAQFVQGLEQLKAMGGIYYMPVQSGWTKFVAVIAVDSYKELLAKDNTWAVETETKKWSKRINGGGVFEDGSVPAGYTNGRLYYKDNNGGMNFSGFTIVENNLFSSGENIKNVADALPTTTTTKRIKVANKEEYNEWKARYDKAVGEQTAAENAVTEAEKYKSLTVIGDIIVPVGTPSLGIWPADGVINGDGHKITNNSKSPLFSTNNGEIHDLISLERSIANTNKGVVTECIVKSTNGYRTYDDNANVKEFTGTSALEDAVYSLRDTYGMKLDAETPASTVDVLEKAPKLYQAKYANATSKNVTSFKVNIGTNALSYAKGKVSGFTLENAVAYIEDEDAETSITNVAVKNAEGQYGCAKARMMDETSSKEFYIPYDFAATELEYARNISTDMVSVCLPFALDSETLKDIEATAYNFKEVDADKNTMWFNVTSSVAANTPCVLVFKEGAKLGKVFNGRAVNFTSTVGADLTSIATETGERRFFGNYKANQHAGDLVTAHPGSGSAVYGIQNGNLVRMQEGDDAWINAFRGFILYKELDLATPGKAPVFRVGLLDEDGNEVNGIESVTTDGIANTFKAVGGNNAIEISTDKACDVKVYSVNGALVKTVRVEAGNTTLPVNAGMYIVNKNKVVVK